MTVLLDEDPRGANWISIIQREKGRPIPLPPPSQPVALGPSPAEMAYSPGQKRDTRGRFGSGGGGGSSGSDGSVHEDTATDFGQLDVPNDMGDFNEIGQAAILLRASRTADALERGSPGRVSEGEGETFPRTVQQMADGLDAVWAQATPDQMARGMSWYADAHDAVSRSALANGLTEDQGFAITAVLSPGRRWEGNLAMAKVVMKMHGDDAPFVPTPENRAKLYAENALPPPRKDAQPPGSYRPSELTGTQLTVIHPSLKGVSGSRNPAVQMELVLGIARGGSIDGLVGGTKVRNFYNNLRNPKDESSVTIDTWQVRAHTDPFTSRVPAGAVPKDGVVKKWTPVNNQGRGKGKQTAMSITWMTGSPSSAAGKLDSGVGMYPMFASAVKVAARKHGVRPNQMQAVIWTVYREGHPDQEGHPE